MTAVQNRLKLLRLGFFLKRLFRRRRFVDPVIVVSGLPRSGTSMLMSMLSAGGVPLVVDGVRTADEDNPKGYYELERVKALDKPGDKTWLSETRGKAIKIISFLLSDLPPTFDYKVSTILRVPITFPAEKFNGVLLSAMSVPDLQGSQGTYYYFSTDQREEDTLAPGMTSGERIALSVTDGVGRAAIPGPENSLKTDAGVMEVPLALRPTSDDSAELTVGTDAYTLTRREYSPWIELGFKAAPGITVRGIARFYLLETSPNIKLYMTQSTSIRTSPRCQSRIPSHTRCTWPRLRVGMPRWDLPRTPRR